jgi:hypothetical protein
MNRSPLDSLSLHELAARLGAEFHVSAFESEAALRDTFCYHACDTRADAYRVVREWLTMRNTMRPMSPAQLESFAGQHTAGYTWGLTGSLIGFRGVM